MRPLPPREPDLDRRWVTRVPPDPHVRFDTNDYSLDPKLVGRRVERPSERLTRPRSPPHPDQIRPTTSYTNPRYVTLAIEQQLRSGRGAGTFRGGRIAWTHAGPRNDVDIRSSSACCA
jgi:Mu transposase-like protein